MAPAIGMGACSGAPDRNILSPDGQSKASDLLNLTGSSSATRCDGVARRDVLRVGSLALGGLTLPGLLRHRAAAASGKTSDGTTPRKTQVIFIELDGGPSQYETYDPKPEAPLEIRGELRAIPTNLTGVYFSEYMAEQAKVMDRLAIIRSVAHNNADHGNSGHMIGTGYYRVNNAGGRQEKPGVGAVTSRVRGQNATGVPAYIALLQQMRGGMATYLGARHDPFIVKKNPNDPNFKVENLSYGPELNFERLTNRRTLLESLDAQKRLMEISAEAEAIDKFTHEAFELITSERAAKAFDLSLEPPEVRDRYGRNEVGQAILLARRLIEADVTFVSVRDLQWDNHSHIFGATKIHRPKFDHGMAALVHDLYERGLDRDVLVVAMGEFGRTKRVNHVKGRDHWAPVMSVAVSGGGLRVGQVIGSSTKHGDYPASAPYHPQNVLAMVYRHLGIDPSMTFPDYQGRPQYLLENRELIQELL
jgi:hypothetical protein